MIEFPLSPPPWSYSSISLFKTCPAKYMAEKVTREVPFKDTDATLYGKALHTVAEEYIRDSKEIPSEFRFVQPLLDDLKKKEGDFFCEMKVGIKRTGDAYEWCEFFDKDVWFRGVADLVIINGNKAYVIDYKTGKSSRYADLTQLELMAAAVFAKYPEVLTIHVALIFVVVKERGAPTDEWFIKDIYTRNNMYAVFSKLYPFLARREAAYNSGVFNPTPNPLCGNWCGHLQCIHNGKRGQ